MKIAERLKMDVAVIRVQSQKVRTAGSILEHQVLKTIANLFLAFCEEFGFVALLQVK
jgi:hypothetical protein